MREQGANIKVICVVLKGPVRCVIMILKGSVLHKQPSLKPKGLKQTKATQTDPLRGDWKTLRAEDRNRKGPGPVDSQRDTGRQGRTSNGRFKGPQRRCWGADGGGGADCRSWSQLLLPTGSLFFPPYFVDVFNFIYLFITCLPWGWKEYYFSAFHILDSFCFQKGHDNTQPQTHTKLEKGGKYRK